MKTISIIGAILTAWMSGVGAANADEHTTMRLGALFLLVIAIAFGANACRL